MAIFRMFSNFCINEREGLCGGEARLSTYSNAMVAEDQMNVALKSLALVKPCLRESFVIDAAIIEWIVVVARVFLQVSDGPLRSILRRSQIYSPFAKAHPVWQAWH